MARLKQNPGWQLALTIAMMPLLAVAGLGLWSTLDRAEAAFGDVDVTLLKLSTAPSGQVIAGSGTGNLVFEVDIINNSDSSDATDLRISDTQDPPPTGVSRDSATATDGTVTTPSTNEINWQLNLPRNTSETMTLAYTVAANALPGLYCNSAVVASVGSPFTLVNTGDDNAADCVDILRRSDMRADKVSTGSGPVPPGSNIGYTVSITNLGPSYATSSQLLVTDTLPPGATLVSWSDPAGLWTCSSAGNIVMCVRNGVNAGESMPLTTETISYVIKTSVSAVPPGNFTNSVVVTVVSNKSQMPDIVPNNNSDTVDRPIGVAAADLSAWKSVTPFVPVPGQEVTYKLRVRNHGPATSFAVVQTDPLPPGYEFLGFVGIASTQCSASAPPVVITCTRASMLPNTSATWEFKAKVPLGPDGRGGNTTSVTASTFDPKLSNNTAKEAASLP